MDNLTYGNPAAHRVRVLYLNADATTVEQGMPLCYNYDTTTNWAGGSHSDGAVTTSATLTVGSPTTAQAKYIEVEDPDVTNIDWFAGVVAPGGWCGKSGTNILLDIYVPNGAIVPVKTVLTSTVEGRTILSINSDTSTFGNPTSDMPSVGSTAGTIDSRAVAIAEETITSAGLCLAKLCPELFFHQGGQIGYELHAGYAGTVQTAVNKMNVEFDQTDNDACLLHCRALLSSTCQSNDAVYRFETNITGAQSGSTYGLSVFMNVGSDTTQDSGGILCPFRVKFNCRALDPNMSALAYICVTHYSWAMTKAADTSALTNPPTLRPWHRYMSYYATPTHFLYANDVATFGGHETTGAITPAAGDMAIPVRFGGNTYYIPACADDGI